MYDEHVQDQASELMTTKGLLQGRLIHPINASVYPNVILSTVESGPFWYGDLEMSDFDALHEVAVEIQQSILLIVGDQHPLLIPV